MQQSNLRCNFIACKHPPPRESPEAKSARPSQGSSLLLFPDPLGVPWAPSRRSLRDARLVFSTAGSRCRSRGSSGAECLVSLKQRLFAMLHVSGLLLDPLPQEGLWKRGVVLYCDKTCVVVLSMLSIILQGVHPAHKTQLLTMKKHPGKNSGRGLYCGLVGGVWRSGGFVWPC